MGLVPLVDSPEYNIVTRLAHVGIPVCMITVPPLTLVFAVPAVSGLTGVASLPIYTLPANVVTALA